MGKQISRCVNNTSRLWKTTEYCGREREYQKDELKVLVYSLKEFRT